MFQNEFVHEGKNELVSKVVSKSYAFTYVFNDIPFLDSHSPYFF